jgi:hypothetical protein
MHHVTHKMTPKSRQRRKKVRTPSPPRCVPPQAPRLPLPKGPNSRRYSPSFAKSPLPSSAQGLQLQQLLKRAGATASVTIVVVGGRGRPAAGRRCARESRGPRRSGSASVGRRRGPMRKCSELCECVCVCVCGCGRVVDEETPSSLRARVSGRKEEDVGGERAGKNMSNNKRGMAPGRAERTCANASVGERCF